ncbi:glycosyltransferase [Moheibacter stercoris]|uniref:Glycosyltransferase involved in cell wall biosynthesis n=1 Tax=Moheibacter stercoris TaxID=1628251 RepID=A0ABV2LSH2_9FLAO
MITAKLLIIICHFNNLEGLEKTILSIKENFKIDILVVDDGSKTKPAEQNLKNLYKNGEVFLKLLPENQGVGKASNVGLNFAIQHQYDLTGRLDCGDIVHPNKYEKQLEFLENNPEIKLLGTWINMVDMEGKVLMKLKHPTDYEAIKKKLNFNSAFTNSSVIFYVSALEKTGLFPEKYNRNGEDYAFFYNFSKIYPTTNLPEFLVDYVVDPNSISSLHRKDQVKNRLMINLDNFEFGIYPILALVQNSIIYFIPRNLMIKLKKAIKYNQ